MKQIAQNLRDGAMTLQEVAVPVAAALTVLVRNRFSLISAGTEGSKIQAARSNLLEKARQRPDQVKQVLESIRTEGLAATYQKVMNKLDAPSALGYSSSGEIVGVGAGIRGLRVGDRVACGGAGAAHGEMAQVPENLCAKIPEGVGFRQAAFTTVGAIALQGVRQADLRLGECCGVIGLGLVGQLTVQLLQQAGVRVLGIDVDPPAVELAKRCGVDAACVRSDPALQDLASRLSGGYGVDAVIITAGASSTDPVELAGSLCRQKGKVVVVGAVPTGFSRASYYNKELDLRMSCSYGPGRYDARYEERGMDYPIGYVRWTENRNMQAFLGLCPKLNLDAITSHVFPFGQAIHAFDLIAGKKEFHAGILLQYDTARPMGPSVIELKAPASSPARPGIGFIGAGSFAQKFLIGNAAQSGDLIGVTTSQGLTARHVAQKYGFQNAVGSAEDLLSMANVNTVFIATRHHLHAEQVMASVRKGKNVFVEKPLCLTEEEFQAIQSAQKDSPGRLMVGFNRRFSPHIDFLVNNLPKNAPRAVECRINAGAIPSSSWIQDPAVGGGRILGEVCHFLDLTMYLADSEPTSLSAQVLPDPASQWDTLTVHLSFKSGSIGSLLYYANGAKALPKEQVEAHSCGVSGCVDDYRKTTVYGTKKKVFRAGGKDKGHAEEVRRFLESIAQGKPAPISFAEICWSTKLAFDTIRSIRERRMMVYPP